MDPDSGKKWARIQEKVGQIQGKSCTDSGKRFGPDSWKNNGSGFREKFGNGFREKIWAGGRENKTRGFKPHFLRPLLFRFGHTLLGTVRPKIAQQPCAVRRHVIPFRECLALGTGVCPGALFGCGLALALALAPARALPFSCLVCALALVWHSTLVHGASKSHALPPLPELAFNAPAGL